MSTHSTRYSPGLKRLAYKYDLPLNIAEKYLRKARQQACAAMLQPTDQVLEGLFSRIVRQEQDKERRNKIAGR